MDTPQIDRLLAGDQRVDSTVPAIVPNVVSLNRRRLAAELRREDSRLLNIYPRDLHNAATSRTLVNPAVNLNCISIYLVLI